MTKLRSSSFLLILMALCLAKPSIATAAPAGNDMVRYDWYFRETLRAIADWEIILADWEKQTPASQRTPVLPVPMGAKAVVWPNPIPALLVPFGETPDELSVNWNSTGKLELARTSGANIRERTVINTNEPVPGYKHPGGGGKDHWYHAYHRRFDQLTQFRPQSAPFSASLKALHDLKPGTNEVGIVFGNPGTASITIEVNLRILTSLGEQSRQSRSIELSGGQETTVSWPVLLTVPGGGMLQFNMTCDGHHYWLPILTHVEDVPAILTGIAKILADTPDPDAQKHFDRMRQQMAPIPMNEPLARNWRSLFEEASALRDELLQQRIHFDTLLFVKRKPYFSEQPYMDAHHLYNKPGGGIFSLSPVRPTGKITPVLDNLGEGIYRDLGLHWQADKLLFSFGNGSDKWTSPQSYHIYENDLTRHTTRQISYGPKNDCEPFYLPGDSIGFTSDRAEHFVMCGANRHTANLFVMNSDGTGVRQLSFNVFNDFNPSLLPDGRILYNRWEYNERSVTSLHKLFTINPDGTMMAPYYGNATIRPNITMFPKSVPNSTKVMALFTAHHGQTHGPIGLIDVRLGMDGDAPITVLTPGVPVTGEKAEDSRCGWFSDPQPLSETTYLCSFTPTVLPWLDSSWALYIGDRHGNLALIYRDPNISCAEPVPLMPRSPPQTLLTATPSTDSTTNETALLMQDVYRGLDGVQRGTAKHLRILEDVPRKGVPEGEVIITSDTEIYTVKRILGTVPIAQDGSAHFLVPANRNIYFEVLDDHYREIQRMRSVVCVKPGENRTCIGCHESRFSSPPNVRWTASSQIPHRPTPPPWGNKTFSFLRDVQPLLNDKCVACHAFDRAASKVILTDDLTDQFNIAYQELVPYISAANAKRWDHPEDVLPRPPYTYGSKVSRLSQLLEKGHYNVTLTDEEWLRLRTWIDANGVYYDRYESLYGNRQIFSAPFRKTVSEVYGRRCSDCHGKESTGLKTMLALTINRHAPQSSRALLAPLARSAGGWEQCSEPVFANANDPDYKLLLTALTHLHATLEQRPREDLVSLRGSPAEFQTVKYPTPPAKPALAPDDQPGNWVFLSDLKWKSGNAGWTPNQDGLPRKDKDIENNVIRLGNRTYRKGIGTHAPSDIVYDIGGGYQRFMATVGGAEANGTVVFKVLGDNKLLFESPILHGLRETRQVDVTLSGIQELRLVVTDGSDNINSDEANWANARLKKLK